MAPSLWYKKSMSGRTLQKIMKEVGMGPTAFAKELGVSHAAVSRWASEDRPISVAMEKHIRRTAEELTEKA